MRAYVAAWVSSEFVPTPLAQISWAHNLVLLEKLADDQSRLWYAEQVRAYGWSSRVLAAQIASGARERQGNAATNFDLVLPDWESEFAQETLKSDYNLDFLRLIPGIRERELEDALVGKVQQMLARRPALVLLRTPDEAGRRRR